MASNSLPYAQAGCEQTSLPLAPVEEMDTLAALKDQAPMQRGLYAYGVMGKSPLRRDILGIDKRNTVYPVKGKDMCVMVSEIDIGTFQKQVKNLFAELTAGQSRTETLLQLHEDVVDLLTQGTTLVPFKFGTILKDEKAAWKLLQDDEAKFTKLLAKFTGRVEWGLKVYADQQAFIQHSAQGEPRCENQVRAKVSRGTAYLLGKKMEEELKDSALARLSEITEMIFQELGKDVYEARLNKTLPQKLTGKKKEMVLNTVYLVEQEKVPDFCKQGKNLMEKYAAMGLEIEVSGPWPPYNFTS